MLLAHKLWKPEKTAPAAPQVRDPDRVLLLHGMGGTGALWRPIAASLEADYEILAPDQRGHGGSRFNYSSADRDAPTFTPLDYGRDVVETLESLDFHPTWVVGHSMGVRTACAVAHLRPDWVRGLVLVDLGFSGVAGGGLGEGLASFLKNLPDRFDSRAAAREYMADPAKCPDAAIGQYLIAVAVGASDGTAGITFPFDKAALIETIHAARDASVSTWVQELGKREVPILVLRGALSLVWSQAEYATERERYSAYPSIRFEEFQGTGHGLPFEKRAEFVARLREFFTAHEA